MSSGFHRLGANAGKVLGWSNEREIMRSPVISPLASVGQITIPVMEEPKLNLKTEIVGEFIDTFSPGPGSMTREQAKQAGYTGDVCDTCGSTRMKISGHCTVCEGCGTTTGCS